MLGFSYVLGHLSPQFLLLLTHDFLHLSPLGVIINGVFSCIHKATDRPLGSKVSNPNLVRVVQVLALVKRFPFLSKGLDFLLRSWFEVNE